MIRNVLCTTVADLRRTTRLFAQFNSGFGSQKEVKPEKDALSDAKSNEFGSLTRTPAGNKHAYLQSENIDDDDDGYDTLEIFRTKKDKYYHRNLLTKLIHSKPVRLREALQVFDEMKKIDRRDPESTHFTLVITGCAKVGYTEKAFELFGLLLKNGLNPTKATITSLFNACAECHNRDLAIAKADFLREWIFEKSYVCNVKQFNAMIKAYAKQGDMKTAFGILKQMAEEGVTVTTETFNMLLMGCISHKEAGLLQAIKIVRVMIAQKCPLDVYTYNLLLRSVRDCSIGSERHLNEFFVKWSTDNSKNFNSRKTLLNRDESSTEDLNSLPLRVCNENNELISTNQTNEITVTKVPNLLSTAVSSAGQVIRINFDSLKTASSRLQLFGGFEGILDHMKSNNAHPNIATFSLLLECSENNLEEETKLISFLEDFKVKPKTDFFNQIIKRRSMRRDIQGALDILLQMQTLRLIPEVDTFGVLAMGCRTKKLGLRLIKDMETAGFTLNIETLGALIKNACVRQDFDYLLALMDVAIKKQIAVNGRVIGEMMYCRDNVRNKLLQHEKHGAPISDWLLTEEFKQPFRTFNLEFKKWVKTVDFERDEDEQDQFQLESSKPLKHKMYLYEKSMREKIRDRVNKEINSF